MVDVDVFRQRLAKLEEYLGHLESMARLGRATVLRDPGLLAQTERWMHLTVEAAIDLGQHLIASRAWRTPMTNRETFQVLEENGVITSELCKQMEGWAGLRNILVHLYLEINHELLLTILEEELDQPRSFASALARVLDGD